jgi:hypothetical protein
LANVSEVAYGCCVGSWERFQRNVAPRTDGRSVVATSGHSGIAVAYNTILTAVKHWPLDALILIHDDLELIDPDTEEKFLAALAEPNVALVGVAGARNVKSLAWWDGDAVGHQAIDGQVIDFGTRTGDVAALEGSVLVLSPWAVRQLWFDEKYTGFHGYDCDIAAIARWRGKRVVVADVDTHHHTQLGFKTPESETRWQEANKRFREKWSL